MIVPDTNLLLYAYDLGSARHGEAQAWLDAVFDGEEIVGLPWQVIWAFIRISTNPRIAVESYGLEQALAIVDGWMRLRHVKLLLPGERHWQLLKKMLVEGQVRGGGVTDAELAALTIEHGGVLHSTDRDFARFPGLRWANPLSS